MPQLTRHVAKACAQKVQMMQQTEPGPLEVKQMVKGLGFRHNNDKRNKAYTYACGGWSSNSSCPQAFSSLDFQCRCDISELAQTFWD